MKKILAIFLLTLSFLAAESGPSLYVHALKTIGANGNTIELDDGSIFTVDGYGYTVMKWQKGDLLVVTQNNGWFPRTSYSIHNFNTEEDVSVSVCMASMDSLKVYAIREKKKEVVLNDGSIWAVSNPHNLYKWVVGDSVIIGANCLGGSAKNIIINTIDGTCVRASMGSFYGKGEFHIVASINPNGNSIALEDGSAWSAIGYSTRDWRVNDRLIIKQNRSFFSNYKYVIQNLDNENSSEANLDLGPFLNGEYYRDISSIDLFQGIIYLRDGTVWKVKNSSTLGNWYVGDAIIIGLNAYNEPFYYNILIDVVLGNYVEAYRLK